MIEGERAGWRALTLRNGVHRGHGAARQGLRTSTSSVDRSTGVDVLFKSPWGLQPPGAPPREGWGGMAFLRELRGRLAGAPAELQRPLQLPRHRDPVPRRGRARRPWDVRSRPSGDDAVELIGRVRCSLTPFALERRCASSAARRSLTLRERVENLSGEAHHLVLGAPLRRRRRRSSRPAAGCERRRARSSRSPEAWEETARLAPGQREPWPHALLQDGGRTDLREVPGAECGTHDDIFLTGLEDGTVAVENPRSGPHVPARLRPHAVPLAVHLAALRRRSRAAAGGLLRARDRAVDLLGQPRGRRRLGRGDRARRGRSPGDNADRRHRGRTRRMRAARVLETVGCDAFVASDPFTVAWLTGFAADETWGPNPFAAPPLAVVRSDASVVAIVSEDEAPALAGSSCEVVAYEGFTLGPARSVRRPACGARLARAERSRGGRGRRAAGPGRRGGGGRRARAEAAARGQGRRRDRAHPRSHRALRRRPGRRARRAARRCERARGLGRGAERDGGCSRRAALAAVRLRERRAHRRDRRPAGRRVVATAT